MNQETIREMDKRQLLLLRTKLLKQVEKDEEIIRLINEALEEIERNKKSI